MTDKKIHLYNTAFIEGAYAAATLAEVDVDINEIEKQLKPLIIKGDR